MAQREAFFRTCDAFQAWARQQPEFIDDDLGYSHGVILFKVSDTIATRSAQAAKQGGLIRVEGNDAGWSARNRGRVLDGLPCEWTASSVDTTEWEDVFGELASWQRAFADMATLPSKVFEVSFG